MKFEIIVLSEIAETFEIEAKDENEACKNYVQGLKIESIVSIIEVIPVQKKFKRIKQ